MPSIYQRAKNWLTETPNSRRKNQSAREEKGWGDANDIMGGTIAGSNQTNLSNKAWLEEFHRNPRLAPLNKLTSDTGVSDFGIYEDDETQGKIKIEGHPLQIELDSHSVPMFFSLWTAYRYMVGEVYIAYDIGNNGPKNFKVFTSTHLVDSTDSKYSFQYGDKTLTYPKKRVIVDLDINLNDPYHKGYGRAGAIMAEIESDSIIQSYLSTFYTNSARADTYISPKGLSGEIPTPEELKNLATQLRNFHQGLENAHKTAVLSFAADIQSAPNNHMEMELLSTRKYLRDTAIQHFSIPPEIMGIIENSNKATVVAAEHIYAKQVRLPLLKHFRDIINTKILPLYRGSANYYFEFDDILPDDDEANLEKAKEGRAAGSITINEHRALLGLPRIKDDIGNTLIIPQTKTLPELVVEVIPASRLDIKSYNYKEKADKELALEITQGLVDDIHEELIIVEGEIYESS